MQEVAAHIASVTLNTTYIGLTRADIVKGLEPSRLSSTWLAG